MYGLIPRANRVALENAEPVKILRYAHRRAEGSGVYIRDRDRCTNAIQYDDDHCVNEFFLEVSDFPSVFQRLEHLYHLGLSTGCFDLLFCRCRENRCFNG